MQLKEFKMKFFAELKNKVRSDILGGRYDPPKNAIARIKYDTLIKEVITELYNEYVPNLANVYIFVSRRLPLSLSWEIAATKGWQKFIKRIHVTDFSLLYRETYGVPGVNKCTCEECKKVIGHRGLSPFPNGTIGLNDTLPEYGFVRGELNSVYGAMGSKSFTALTRAHLELPIQSIDTLVVYPRISQSEQKCPHAKAMIFIKAKTKKGN